MNLEDRNVCILPVFSKEDAEQENAILKGERVLLNQRVQREKLKIKNLKTFNGGMKEMSYLTETGQ